MRIVYSPSTIALINRAAVLYDHHHDDCVKSSMLFHTGYSSEYCLRFLVFLPSNTGSLLNGENVPETKTLDPYYEPETRTLCCVALSCRWEKHEAVRSLDTLAVKSNDYGGVYFGTF